MENKNFLKVCSLAPTSLKIQHKSLIVGVRHHTDRVLDQLPYVARPQHQSPGSHKRCLSSKTMREGTSVRFATHELPQLIFNVKVVAVFKPEGEHCEIATAQLTLNLFR